MDDLISRNSLISKISEKIAMAGKRVNETPSSTNGICVWVNPAYTRYVAQLTERTDFKQMIMDEPSISSLPDESDITLDSDEELSDMIYREDMTDREFENWVRNMGFFNVNIDEPILLRFARDLINDALKYNRIKAETPQTGHWIKTAEGFSPYECSKCGKIDFMDSDFCPNCGARMEGVSK